MDFILAQILGGIALILVCVGYFFKKKSHFLIIQTVANFFYAGAFYVVGAYVGAGLVVVSILRCIYLYFAEKKSFKYTLHFLPIFIVCYISITVIFWDSPWDFLPLITSTLFTIGFVIKNLQTMRYVLLIPNAILVLYNILKTTYTSAILDFIEFIVIMVVIVKHILKNRRTKNDKQRQSESHYGGGTPDEG